ncbi:hypothetical protein VTK56DRAFT_2656 [Thermocarpiscus australiensis]
MQIRGALKLLFLGLSVLSAAEATMLNVDIAGGNGRGIQRRQDDGDSGDSNTSSTTAAPSKTSSSASSTTERTTPTVSSTSRDASTSSPTTSPSSSPSTSRQQPPSSTSAAPPPSSSTPPPETTSAAETSEASSSVILITKVITTTNANGLQTTLTTQSLSTQTPGLANNGGDSHASGMSTRTRNTVIGVVVGIGGAIVLGGLAVVAWRIWGRKKHQEENDGLMDYGSTVEKPESGGSMGGRTPFQSTLESYHAPTQVNKAANF